MARFSKNKIRQKAYANGYRSGLEDYISDTLKAMSVVFEYEQSKIDYLVPASKHKYTPDFKLPNGTFIETKGRWTAQDRQKHKLIKEQHPEVDIKFIFSNPNEKISKGSKTSYADICDKNGWDYIGWKDPIPKQWLHIEH